MTYRVIQWATGGVGRAAIEGILDHPELELAGCWVHSADKEGRDVAELAGRPAAGVAATTDVDALLATDADCVLYSPLLADPAVVDRILRSGKNVVTPLGWFYPTPEDRARMEESAQAGGVTLHGTGIHPGGITERFPLMLSALSNRITHVRAEEFSDIRTYDAPDVVRHVMLFGATPEEAGESIMLSILGAGFIQSVHMVADVLGFDLDPELATSHEVAVATESIESPIGPIEPGLVAAQRFRWSGTVDEEPVVTAAVNWFMGQEHLDPAWSFGPEGERFEVEITGDPPVKVTFHGLHPDTIEEGLERNRGIVATAMHCVNAVPYVCAAEPGLKTYLDLPLVAGAGEPMILDRFKMDGKVAVVTGAGQGIGRGVALGLAEAGCDVVCAARTEADVESVAEEVRALGRRAVAVPTDVMHEDQIVRMLDAAVDELGRLDVLVNNAGGTMPRAGMDTGDEFFSTALRFNATTAFLASKHGARRMVDTAGEGAIVNISSRSSDMVQTAFVAYAAGKAALNMMTRNLAAELAPRVRVNAISVGGVATRALDVVLTDDGLRRQFLDGTPMHRPGEPEDIACAVLYLASPASSWVTGKILQVDGGTEAPAMSVPVAPLEPTD